MKLEEYINTDSICFNSICFICVLVLILGITALYIYSLNWVICSISKIYTIYALAVVSVFVLIVFFGLVFTLYKVYCKKEEYAIELKRLGILEKHLENSRRCGC